MNKDFPLWYNDTNERRCWKVSNEMTREELISITIDKYTDLQRIKRANGNVQNDELDYQLKVTVAKLSSLGISVEDITLSN